MGPFHLKKRRWRRFPRCRCFENILFELRAVDYKRLPIFVLIRFWEIKKFLTNGLRESPCIFFLLNNSFLDKGIGDMKKWLNIAQFESRNKFISLDPCRLSN
ncbi:unnamed protein product [Tenebrio molitor]|nr:unnamed protein product [Tenebrio molitor]